MAELLAMDEPRNPHRHDAKPASTSTTTSATGHPLLGRRMPDLEA